MTINKTQNPSTDADRIPSADGGAPSLGTLGTGDPTGQQAPTAAVSLPEFIRSANEQEIKADLSQRFRWLLSDHSEVLEEYCCIALMDPNTGLGAFEADYIFSALTELNPKKDKNVLLFLLSPGGLVEAAYQIAKLCKSFSKERFIVTIPRQAKSAATLIAIGADEIHMGPLGHLGPIDPQLGGLPALGVSQALETIASLSEKFPGSAEMFARYLRMAVTVEQIGYCERVSVSAAQYAERLLSTKPGLVPRASKIARELVYEYKDHGFVIDLAEAQQHLGVDWIRTGTRELLVAEKIYDLYDEANLFLGAFRQKRLLVIGRFDTGVFIFDNPKQ